MTGASGRLGGQVVRLLAADPSRHLVAVSRRPVRFGPQPARVTTALADYADLAALRRAFRDVDTLVFVSSDGDAAKLLVHHHNVVTAAADDGVAHVVALSSLDADLDSPFCYAVTNRWTEQLLHDSGCPTSIARASIYSEFFMDWLVRARTSGELRLPAAGGRISLVSRSDVGRCLAALALAGPTGRHHDITGPDAPDPATIAALAARAWGTPIRYTDVPRADHVTEMARSGEDPWWMHAYATMFDSVRDGRWQSVSGEVSRLTGVPPASLGEVLAAAAPSGSAAERMTGEPW